MIEIDKTKLTLGGSMNYILQIIPDDENENIVHVDIYHPRKNNVWSGKLSKDEIKQQVEETIERMKIAITLMQEYLDGKRDKVYYWQLEDGK